jgi:hypothetical protein
MAVELIHLLAKARGTVKAITTMAEKDRCRQANITLAKDYNKLRDLAVKFMGDDELFPPALIIQKAGDGDDMVDESYNELLVFTSQIEALLATKEKSGHFG